VYDGRVTRAEFEALVEEVLAELPPEFARYLENLAVIVEDEPSPEQLRELGLRPERDSLFGLYQGVPMDQRGYAFGNALPDHITIFYRPLVRAFRSRERLRREVRRTVLHEIGHHFGFDERTLRKEGY